MNVVVLYTELAGYILNTLNQLSKENNVFVIHWPINKSDAPFHIDHFSFDRLKLKSKSEYSSHHTLKKSVENFKPDALIVSGWQDKDYLKIVKAWQGKVPTITIGDNPWKGTLKQWIATLIGPYWLKQYFSHGWGIGKPQRKFFIKIGFKNNEVIDGFYVADLDKFNQQYAHTRTKKAQSFPHVFLYVGRYMHHKGIYELWQAFKEVKTEMSNDWELWCIGTGPEFEERIQYPAIKHFGFKQPDELAEITKDAGVFVLPSHKEHWGVVVQEFAAAGFPLICSHQVMAATAFLEDQKNGFLFQAGSMQSLKEQMKKMMELSDVELMEMGRISHEKAQVINNEQWIKSLEKVVEEYVRN